MTAELLTCTRCGEPVELAEDVIGYLNWGPVVICDDGTVRLADPDQQPSTVMSDNSDAVGRPRACCTNQECGYQWRLRRPFNPAA